MATTVRKSARLRRHVPKQACKAMLWLRRAVSCEVRALGQSNLSGVKTFRERSTARGGSVRGEAAIDWQSHAEHEAGPGAAKPEDGRGDLIGPPQPSDRLIPHDLLHRVGLLLKHVRHHGRIDRSWAYRIDANAPRRIFKRGALGQADHPVLGCVVGRPAWQPDEAPERRAVDYGAAALRAHVAKLVLHAGPDTAKIDGVHAIELLGRFIGRVTRRNLYTGIVERHVQAAEAGASALHHRGDLRLVRHIAGNADRLVSC